MRDEERWRGPRNRDRAQMGGGTRWLVVAAAVACGGPHGDVTTVGEIEVSNAYMAEALTPDAVAVYFTVTNTGDTADTLTALTAAFAAGGAIHEQRARGGTVVMEPVGPVAVAAGGSLTLAPGGLHGMLVNLSRLPKHAERVGVTLSFARAGAVLVPFEVVSYSALEDRAEERR